MKKYNVYISRYDVRLAPFISALGYSIVSSVRDSDFVLFGGGADIDPSLYFHGTNPRTGTPDQYRESYELAIFETARRLNIPMVGICRGAQFLCIMAGGTLYQDVAGHTITHQATVLSTGQDMLVSSTHHQMMNPVDTHHEVLMGCGNRSPYYREDTDKSVEPPALDYEVVYFPYIKALASQPHPEYMEESSSYYRYFKDQVALLLKNHPAEGGEA